MPGRSRLFIASTCEPVGTVREGSDRCHCQFSIVPLAKGQLAIAYQQSTIIIGRYRSRTVSSAVTLNEVTYRSHAVPIPLTLSLA